VKCFMSWAKKLSFFSHYEWSFMDFRDCWSLFLIHENFRTKKKWFMII